jgi:hypothetical protein
MSEFKVYDLSEVTCNFGGFPIESGYGDGDEVIKIEQLSPDFVTKEGADGSVTRSKTNKRLTRITITLLQTSPANAILSTLNNADRLAANGAGVVPILIRDRQGLSVFAAAECWVETPPPASYGGSDAERQWVLMAARPERFDGGN